MTVPKADWRTAYACQAVRLGFILAVSLSLTPQLRLLEANVCRTYYREYDPSMIDGLTDSVVEEVCKVVKVQQGVSDITGLVSGSTILPALLAAFPYLVLHRVLARKQLLLVNLFGLLLAHAYNCTILYFYNSFDPTWLCLAGLFNFVGGGFPILFSILQTLLAESVPQQSLSSFQLRFSAISLVTRLAGSAVALVIMQKSVWLPMLLALITYATTFMVAWIFIRKPTQSLDAHLGSSDDNLNECDMEAEPWNLADSTSKVENSLPTDGRRRMIVKALLQFRRVLPQCILPIAIMSFYAVGVSLRAIIPYWMSRRYEWELRDVGWVQLGESLFTAGVVAVFPRLGTYFYPEETVSDHVSSKSYDSLLDHNGRPNTSTSDLTDDYLPPPQQPAFRQRDLGLARFSILLYAFGALLLGLSWHWFPLFISLAVMAGGVGFYDTYYSYLASWFTTDAIGEAAEKGDSEDLTTMYMVLSLVVIIAENLGGFLVSKIYSFSLSVESDDQTQPWATSLPIWLCMLSFVIAWLVSGRTRPLS